MNLYRRKNKNPLGIFLYMFSFVFFASSVAYGADLFTVHQKLNADERPSSIISLDYNNDKKMDLAVVAKRKKLIYIFAGQGDGSFGNGKIVKMNLKKTSRMASMTSADFNGDGNVDIAVGQEKGPLLLLFGNGKGSFRMKDKYSVKIGPNFVDSGDFNGDGKTDLLTLNSSASSLSIFPGKGDGKFKKRVDTLLGKGEYPWHLAKGDFNRDGKLDIALDEYQSGEEYIKVLLNKGNGLFEKSKKYALNASPNGIVTADFNGDGFLDIVNGCDRGDGLYIFLGKGDGTFEAHKNRILNQNPTLLLAEDFNVDGNFDIAFLDAKGKNIYLVLGNADGSFEVPTHYKMGGKVVDMVAEDFNADGRRDLAVINSLNNDLTILLNKAK